MDNDNVYPVTSKHYFPSVQRAKQEVDEDEFRRTLDQLPILRDVIEHLTKQIAFFDSVDSITADLERDPQAHVNEVAANKLAKKKLQIECSYILTKVEDAAKRNK